MALVALAFRVAPDEARAIFQQIVIADRAISRVAQTLGSPR